MLWQDIVAAAYRCAVASPAAHRCCFGDVFAVLHLVDKHAAAAACVAVLTVALVLFAVAGGLMFGGGASSASGGFFISPLFLMFGLQAVFAAMRGRQG